MKIKHITLFEHETLKVGNGPNQLPINDMAALYKYVTNYYHREESISSNPCWLMTPANDRGNHSLKAQNYVGIIQFADGCSIEILPKLHKLSEDANSDKIKIKSRELVIKMLKTLKNSPFKYFHNASLDTTQMHIFDIFISMFLQELEILVRRGIKSKYVNQEKNLLYFKGKLLVSQNINKNYGLMHSNYMCFEEYSVEIPENRLIKCTLELLEKIAN